MTTKFVLKHSFDPKAFKVDYAKELNDEQRAVVSDGDGRVLVLAGAGSGKTRTIVYRVAYLLEKGIRPEHILLVTFTNKAAKQMLLRIEQLLGQFPKGLWGGTFHHVANLLLRRYATHLGFKPNFTILDDEDSRDLLKVAIKDLNIDVKKRRFPSASVVQSLISLGRNTEVAMRDLLMEVRPEFVNVLGELEAVSKAYEERKRTNNQMDFDDLLIHLKKLLTDHPDVRKRLSEQFRYVLVDEYQDTNTLQAAIVSLLSEAHGNLLVVGDDAQSIYSFRGADIDNILKFPKRFPGTTTFKLETNYRSTQPILNLANAVIVNNTEQFSKHLMHVREGTTKPALVPAASPKQEAEFIAEMLLTLRDEGIRLNSMAVLFRAAHMSQTLEFELTRRDIPYEFRGGVRFFERAHIKDVIAYLRAIANPTDEVAWLRILGHQVGIGSQTAGKIYQSLQQQAGLPQSLPSIHLDVPGRSQSGWKAVQLLLSGLLAKDYAHDVVTLVDAVSRSSYRDYLIHQYPNAEDRMDDLEQLATFARQYDSLEKFLAEVSLQEAFGVEAVGGGSKDEEAVVLSTIHQAKGLEWEAVFLLHLIEPGFPNPRALLEEAGLEEERRLFYVAVTRAMTHLYCTYPLASDTYRLTSMRLHEPSRFLTEVDEALFEKYQIVEEGREKSEEQDDDHEPVIQVG